MMLSNILIKDSLTSSRAKGAEVERIHWRNFERLVADTSSARATLLHLVGDEGWRR